MVSQKIKRPLFFILCACFLVFIGLFFYATSDFRLRNNLKKQCGIGMDCACFFNIVENRLTIDQVHVFTKFLDSVKKRPTASILEFTDENSAREISSLIALCRLDSQQHLETKKQKGSNK